MPETAAHQHAHNPEGTAMNLPTAQSSLRPVLTGTIALGALIAAGWAANTWPDFKTTATVIGVIALAALCSLGGLALILANIAGNDSSEPPRQPQTTAHAPHTRDNR
jgi:hypothetical protein